jgi:hypothetical protein
MASFQNSYDCFILRGREGNEILQRIQIRDTRFLKDMITIPATIAGIWSVQRRQFTAEELAKVRPFQRYIRFTSIVLLNSEYPGTFTRLIRAWTPPMPTRGGLEVPVGCVLDAGGFQELNQYVHNFHNAPDRIQWIKPDEPVIQPRERLREASISFSYNVNLQRIPSFLTGSAARPVASRIPVFPTIQALKPFVARVLAEAARNKAEECPITLDSMASCRKLYVPTCGHVCSDDGCTRLEKCPVCRERTVWTPVEFTA